MAEALQRCQTRYLCFIDADLHYWTTNIPAARRAVAATSSGAHMTVASFSDGRRRVITPALYWPSSTRSSLTAAGDAIRSH
jgi:hypothetical protein